MPQMSPINWLNLFLIFSITFMIFCVMNYYSYTPTMPKPNCLNKKLTLNNPLSWKW